MKNLSIEEKAEAYDKALEIAREELQTCGSTDCEAAEQIFRFFPELNEDEKIMDYLITYFTNIDDCASNLKGKDIVAWVKRQGDHANFRNKIQIGDKVTRNEAGILVNISQLKRIAKPAKNQGEKKHKFSVGDIISNGKVEFRVDNIVKNAIGQDCYFLVNIEREKNGTRYLKLTNSEGKTHNYGEITWLCEQVDAKFIEKTPTNQEKADDEEYNGEDYGIDGLWHAINILERTLGKVSGYQTDDGFLSHQCAITAVKKLYKQNLNL